MHSLNPSSLDFRNSLNLSSEVIDSCYTIGNYFSIGAIFHVPEKTLYQSSFGCVYSPVKDGSWTK